MVSSRTATALVGLAVSVVITVFIWWYFGNPFLFVFLPFIPFLFRRRSTDKREPKIEVKRC
ncbi:MAG: hypothetical protein SV377_07110, partial [Halobacteria archaeon]|nr:hypothetical protein [Halobacteria archaeon]